MESGQRVSRRGRKLGSSRRQQMREPADGQDAPVAPEPLSWSAQAQEELQDFFQNCGAKERGFVTRQDLEVAKFSFLGSEDELEMIFNWVDVERKGRLSLEEFSSGLKNIFGSSLSTHRLRRRRPRPAKRLPTATSFLELEEADAEEREAFLTFMEQLGTGPFLPEQAEIWRLWRKLRQEEPQLAGNLEGFLARMSSRLQEVQASKEALELTLRKCDSDHHREVQRLYEEMEQQIVQERQQLQAEVGSLPRLRGLALSSQVHDVLAAKELKAQQLAAGHRELEAQLQRLSSTQQEASAENLQLREAERDLAGRLEEVRGQLQVTRGHLASARGRVSWQTEDQPSVPSTREKVPDPPATAPEEAPLPELFGDNDDWDQLLSGFRSPPHGALQLTWSPPPHPESASGPQTPRVVRQISISEPQALPSAQEPAARSDGAPSLLPGVLALAKDREGVEHGGRDIGPEPLVQAQSLEPTFKPGPPAEAHFLYEPPGAPGGESQSLEAAALRMLMPLEAEPPPQGLEEEPREEEEEIKGVGGGSRSPGSAQALEAPGLPLGPGEQSQDRALPAPLPLHTAPARAGTEAPGPGKPPPASGPPPMALPRAAAGPQGPTQTFPSVPEPGARPRPPATNAHQEGWPGSPRSREARAEGRPEDPGTDSGEAGQLLALGDHRPGEPLACPDYVFHVIFLGDSGVGKTSFLHLLHHNSFASGPTATVGVDFRVKTLLVDNKWFALQLWDTAGQERYHSLTRQLLRKADGVVLMYDLTSQSSFARVRYWLHCLQDAGADGVAVLLLGNKTDCEEVRQVPTEAGRHLAQELGVSFGECSAALGHNILEPMVSLARSLRVQEDRLKRSLVDVVPKRPPKRAGCCS
ncbi:LOW QUALITY PROTEIN: ras-related protein Rab-44 [Lepus europaeus]|uniref:LOW QUALITY PROTEIN: ras-related protein Rab-44 n=1 Tax=Lepus europaeus TaxID=9983 RepID=UPI002B4A2DCA|nr:LOW QUALITY PROTEIN: ras-related protein Rab-44 [Lepus europaeus]